MSSENVSGPSRPKKDSKDINYCGLVEREVKQILKVVDNLSDCYVSEDASFAESGSEYIPESSSESELLESDDEYQYENDIEQNIEPNVEEENGDEQEEIQPTEKLNIHWADNIFMPQKHAFNNNQSGINPDLNLNKNSKEIDYFSCLFTDDLADLIVQETNRIALQSKDDWKELDKSEFYVFLTLNLLMTRNKKLGMHEYWSKEPLLYSPIFGQCMARDFFHL